MGLLGVIMLFGVAYLILSKVKRKADSVNYAMEEKERRRKEAIRKAEEKRIKEIDEEFERLDKILEGLDEDEDDL